MDEEEVESPIIREGFWFLGFAFAGYLTVLVLNVLLGATTTPGVEAGLSETAARALFVVSILVGEAWRVVTVLRGDDG